MYEYSAEVLRVVDGDTVDVLIDCGFSTLERKGLGFTALTPQKAGQGTRKKRLGDSRQKLDFRN